MQWQLDRGMCQEAIQDIFPECCRRQTDVRRQEATLGGALLRQLIDSEWRQLSAGVCLRSGLCRSDILTAAELTEDIDE